MARGVALACLLACAGASSVARAEPRTDPKAAAEQLFEDGRQLVAAKRYEEACPKFAESLHLDPGIGIMLHLASCWEKAGKPASAWAQFREAEQVAMRERDNRAEVARRRAEALEPKLYRVTIKVQGEIPGLDVVRDGVRVGRPQWGIPLPFDPGEHVVVADAPGKTRWQTKINVPADAGATELTIPELKDLPRVATHDPNRDLAKSDPHRGRGQRTFGLVVVGVGVAGLAVGTYFGLHAKSLLDDSNADGHCKPDNHCDPLGGGLRNDARSAGDISTIAFGAGLAAVSVGLLTYFTAPKPLRATPTVGLHVTPVVGPGNAGLVMGGGF